MKRYRAKSQKACDSALKPVQPEYMRIVMSIVLARPMRSPSTPKMRPPVAHPSRKIAVE